MSSFDCLMAVKFVRVSGPVRWGDHLNEITLICICPDMSGNGWVTERMTVRGQLGRVCDV